MKICKIHGLLNSIDIVSDGRCKYCIKIKNHVIYEQNRVYRLKQCKAYYHDNKEQGRKSRRKYWNENKEHFAKVSKIYRKENSEILKKNKREYYQKLRSAALSYYSDDKLECALCGIKEYTYLCLDHIDGGGTKQRAENSALRGKAVYAWVKKNDYPLIFRVLCYNCNFAVSQKSFESSIQANYRLRIKLKALEAYCNGILKCALCNIIDPILLTIDHIDGGGKKQLRELNMKGGVQFYRWLAKNHFPEGYRVLCHNHNCSKPM